MRELFGDERISAVDVYLGEGISKPGTAVFADDPTRRLEIIWQDDGRTTPREVRMTGATSAWQTSEGLSLGTRLTHIEQMNGDPFRLTGFAWDYWGTIVACDRGRLTYLGCHSRPRTLVVRLGPESRYRDTGEYNQVMGDRVYSSGHPAMQHLDPSVYQLIIPFVTGNSSATVQ